MRGFFLDVPEIAKALMINVSEFLKKGLAGRLNILSVVVLLAALVTLVPLLATTQVTQDENGYGYLIPEILTGETETFNISYNLVRSVNNG